MKIVISDFGSVISKKELQPDSEIQTRYYRAPEIILQCGCNEKCDIWSLGCMIFEILTGQILFDPDKDKNHTRDFFHILAFFEKCGQIPLWMIQKCPFKNEVFSKKGTLKNMNYNNESFVNSLVNKITHEHKLCSLLIHMLTIDYKCRINAYDLYQKC
jgi:serine/threonine-protein kinase SRPK3